MSLPAWPSFCIERSQIGGCSVGDRPLPLILANAAFMKLHRVFVASYAVGWLIKLILAAVAVGWFLR